MVATRQANGRGGVRRLRVIEAVIIHSHGVNLLCARRLSRGLCGRLLRRREEVFVDQPLAKVNTIAEIDRWDADGGAADGCQAG